MLRLLCIVLVFSLSAKGQLIIPSEIKPVIVQNNTASPTSFEFPLFGKVDSADIFMKEYDLEKGAGAVKLFDYQHVEVNLDYYSLRTTTERWVRIKILNRSGYEHANINIAYLNRYKAKITDLKANIFYIDSTGKLITLKIDKSQIFKDKSDGDIKNIAFTFPNVRPGCIIEYRYTQKNKNGIVMSPWMLQDKIPTVLSVSKISVPREIEIKDRVVSSTPVTLDLEAARYNGPTFLVHYYSAKNIPSYHPEPFISSERDCMERIEYFPIPRMMQWQLYSVSSDTWKAYSRILLRAPYFGQLLTKKIPGTQTVIDSANRLSSPKEKMEYLYNQVRNTVTWDNEQNFICQDLARVWKEKTGSSGELNLLLLNLLRQSGVHTYPILVSTREHGRADPDFKTLSQFNGVDILYSDSNETYVLDATQKFPFDITPPNILNSSVLLVDSTLAKWVTVSDNKPFYKRSLLVSASLGANGNITGRINAKYFYRAKLLQLNASETENGYDDSEEDIFTPKFQNIHIDSIQELNKTNIALPLEKVIDYSQSISNTGNLYFLEPFSLASFIPNPFTQVKRTKPVDFGSNMQLSFSMFLEIPSDYTIEELPKNILLRMSDSSILLKLTYQKGDGNLLADCQFQILRSRFEPEEYAALKEFFDRIYTTLERPLMLKRKEN
jgi:hypothetical protein